MSSDQQDKSVELTFTVPWGIIAAKAWGDACLSPVIVVHGIQDSAGSFDRLIPFLPKAFYYVCIDLPGHGKSTRLPKGIRLDFMIYINAINRVVRQLKWDQFIYIGHSLGGQLGTYYTAMYPEQVLKLVVLDAVAPGPYRSGTFLKYHSKYTEQLVRLEDKMLHSSPPSYTYEAALQRMIDNRPSPIKRESAERIMIRVLKKGPNGYYFATDQRLKMPVIPLVTIEEQFANLSKIKCPHLLVATKILCEYLKDDNGDQKRASTLEIYKKNKNFELVVVDGYHDIHNDEPALIGPIVSKFLIQQQSML